MRESTAAVHSPYAWDELLILIVLDSNASSQIQMNFFLVHETPYHYFFETPYHYFFIWLFLKFHDILI